MDNKNVLSKLCNFITKSIFAYVPPKKTLQVLHTSKQLQTQLYIDKYVYYIFHIYYISKINILNYKHCLDFYNKMILKCKDASIDQIEIGICYCIIDSLKQNELYTVSLFHYELIGVYIKMKKIFGYKIKLLLDKQFYYDIIDTYNHYVLNKIKSFLNDIDNDIKGLVITYNGIDDNKVKKCLLNVSKLQFIYEVDVNGMKLTGNDNGLLSMINGYKYLHKIEFNCVNMSLRCIEMLKKSCSCGNIQQLVLIGCHLNDKSLYTMCNNNILKRICMLNVSNNKITDIGFDYLCDTELFELKYLNVSYNKLTENTIIRLNKHNSFDNVEEFDLSFNNLGNSIYILFLMRLYKVKYLNVMGCYVDVFDKVNNDKVFPEEYLMKSLIHLNYAKNVMSFDLFEYLMFTLQLVSVNLSSCKSNVDNLFKMLNVNEERCSRLMEMYLSNNDSLTSESLINVVCNKKIFPKLMLIDLFKTGIKDMFANFLLNNETTIKYINVDVNNSVSCLLKEELYKKFLKYSKC